MSQPGTSYNIAYFRDILLKENISTTHLYHDYLYPLFKSKECIDIIYVDNLIGIADSFQIIFKLNSEQQLKEYILLSEKYHELNLMGFISLLCYILKKDKQKDLSNIIFSYHLD